MRVSLPAGAVHPFHFLKEKRMKLFTQFAPLVQAGVVVHLTLRAVGGKMQLEILPACDSGETGIAIPPRAFLAPAEDLDKDIPDFLDTYVSTAMNLSDQIAETKAVLIEAKKGAEDAVKAARTPTKPANATNSKPSKPLDRDAGMLGGGDNGGSEVTSQVTASTPTPTDGIPPAGGNGAPVIDFM